MLRPRWGRPSGPGRRPILLHSRLYRDRGGDGQQPRHRQAHPEQRHRGAYREVIRSQDDQRAEDGESTRTATSIAATVATERKTPWVKAAHYTLPGSEGLARFIYPGTWKVDSASFALGGPGSATGIRPKIIQKSSAARIIVQAGPKRTREKYGKTTPPRPGPLLCAHTGPCA